MISGQPGRHRIGTIGVTKLVKHYTALALAVLLRVCMLYVLLFKHIYMQNNYFACPYCRIPFNGRLNEVNMLGRRIIGGMRYAYAHAHSAVERAAGAIIYSSMLWASVSSTWENNRPQYEWLRCRGNI